jgi:hypothetical protein
MYLRVIACEVAFREICQLVAVTRNVVDLDFLTQGHHDHPALGQAEIQRRIDTVPAGKYDALLLGYGLCSNILVGLRSAHTRLVVPRAHDCITFFLGSKERYQDCFTQRPGTYYFTSGWLELRQRRGGEPGFGGFMPAHSGAGMQQNYAQWVAKYGEEQAKYLAEVIGQWEANYSHGALIDFDFARPLGLREQVQKTCAEKGWQYEELEGDLSLLRRWIEADWDPKDFLVVPPGRKIVATFDERIIADAPADEPAAGTPAA